MRITIAPWLALAVALCLVVASAGGAAGGNAKSDGWKDDYRAAVRTYNAEMVGWLVAISDAQGGFANVVELCRAAQQEENESGVSNWESVEQSAELEKSLAGLLDAQGMQVQSAAEVLLAYKPRFSKAKRKRLRAAVSQVNSATTQIGVEYIYVGLVDGLDAIGEHSCETAFHRHDNQLGALGAQTERLRAARTVFKSLV